MSRRTLLTSLAVYAAAAALLVGFVVLRVKTQHRFAAQAAPESLPYGGRTPTPPDEHAKPFFSLHTSRTYATTDRARVFVNYRGVKDLDFRVYKVKDPVQFFRQLDDPHRVGEDEEAAVGKQIERKPTFLEKLRQFKSVVYGAIKGYVRAQLQSQSRKGFNQKFRASDEDDTSNRTPLNVADYARVPLLNPDQMVSSWREKLPPLEDVYDRRMISLGRREPGVYLIEAVNGDLRAFGVTIVTDIATVQKTSPDGSMLVYAVERKSGAPREGVRVEVLRAKQPVVSGVTDGQGLLSLKVVDRKKEEEKRRAAEEAAEAEEEGGAAAEGEQPIEEPVDNSYLVMATQGDNFAISDLDSYYFGGEGEEGGAESLKSYLYTDRPVYRPEQKVYFKGIMRERTEGGYRLPAGRTVSVTVDAPDGSSVYQGELALSSRGTFSGEFDLPEESALGSYNINAQLDDASASGYFDVQEYKKPEYKVKVTTPQAYVRTGERTKFTVTANYYFGSPVARAAVKYYVYRSRDYGWWGEGGDSEQDEFGEDPTAEEGGGGYGYGYDEQMMLEGEGRLDASGRLDVEFTVPQAGEKETWDYTYRLDAEVTDAARRSLQGSTSFTGVRSFTVAYAGPERYVYYQGEPARINVTARDREGRPVQTNVGLTFYERRWEKVIKRDSEGYEYPDYETRERELHRAGVQTNEQGEAVYEYAVPAGGSILIKTSVEEAGRPVQTEAGYIWATDREGQFSDVSYQGEGVIKLVPDKKSYRVGETAKVLALLPTDKAHLLVTTEMTGILTTRRMGAPGRAVVIEVPVEARYAPNVFLNVTYVRNSDLYSETVSLSVPARDKLLDLQIIPNKKEFRPRETASYTLLARNGDGSPAAGAEISFGVVDESIYQIAPEGVEDIRRAFYGRTYGSSVQMGFSVDYYFSGYAGQKVVQLARGKRARQLADMKNEADLANPLVRKIFKDTAYWQPNVVAGADGKATVKVELPDNLTTWRATARAVTADTKVGVAVSRVVERKDLILRLAMPRFLTAGDIVTLSGIAHNYTKSEKVTRISVEVAGAELLDPAQQTATIPSLGEHRVNWRVRAPASGELKVIAKALTGDAAQSDALEMGIPVVPKGLKNTRADSFAFAEEEADKTVTLTLPANADPNARVLRVEATPSIAGALFGALDYLTSYPYGCTEQTMSSFLPNVIVTEALRTVESARVSGSNDVGRKARRGLRRLYAFQHDDGGWGWWKDDQTNPWMTAYVVDGLVLARAAGYEVDEARLERGRNRLREMLAGADEAGSVSDDYAYMAYSLAASGDRETRFLDKLFGARARLSHYGRALLALALHARGDRRAQGAAAEIERSARGGGGEANWESVEATALSVKALARTLPGSEVLPRAARWLVRSRRFGHHWLSTKETAFAIYGLIDYLKVSRELNPDYSLEIYVNGTQVLAKQMTAAEAASAQVFTLQRRGGEVGQSSEVRFVKRGRGMLYLSTSLTHHTNDEQTPAAGVPALKLTREYLRLSLTEKDDGTLGWKTEPLSADVRSGDIIVSRLRLEGERARYLMVEDPIPAGCEQVSEVSGIELGHAEKDWSDWYSAREFRDNRSVLFLDYFDGSATFQYAMRVQVPGQFRAAPARAELMYQPDTRANSANGALNILDK
ncbi:MAG TPA: MG2 domain-containing protein [Pyrinomonadaceae bacterium]|nr:MG2 domain-containing protein [Pyrinomonadaceae bacterium]